MLLIGASFFCFFGISRTAAYPSSRLISPFVLETKNGKQLHILTNCPQAVLQRYRSDLVDTIAHRDVVSMHLKQDTEETRQLYECGLFFQPLVSLFKKFGSRNASLEASVLHNICANGIITDTDLLGMGYQIDPICKSCSASQVLHLPSYRSQGKTGARRQPFRQDYSAGP